jgi:peptide/nickel transport system substrate-binding protein
MSEDREHSYIPKLKQQFAEGRCSRREFLRTSTLLGVSAAAAYTFVGKVTGDPYVKPARAEMPRGGNLRIAMPVQQLTTPHAYSWGESDISRNVVEYATRTGQDNVTRPSLVAGWQASDDLRSWTFKLRDDVTWHNGRPFVADDLIWNIQHALDPANGSSMIGLMKGYMLNDVQVDGEDTVEIWDANALEKIDDHTVRFNLKAPQLAVPEHLFHYPMHILDPEEGGTFGAGSNGTGPFDLVEVEVGIKATLKARNDYWGEGPYLDTLQMIDLGQEGAARVGALASKQIHGLRSADLDSIELLKRIPHVDIYQVATAQTGVARMQVDQEPFTDPRVRKAMRLAVDPKRILELAYRNLGLPAQHHHVCDIHPEFADIPDMARDVGAAKALLAEAGFPNGIEVEIACKPDPAWELQAVLGMIEQWKDAGINVNVNVMPSASFWDVWDKVPFGFTEWTHRPLGVMVLALAYRSGVPWNESHYANPEFDALLAEAEGLADVEARRAVMAKIEVLMQEDGPLVQPLWRGVFSAFDKRVKGFQKHPTDYIFGEELALES